MLFGYVPVLQRKISQFTLFVVQYAPPQHDCNSQQVRKPKYSSELVRIQY